MLKSYCGRYSVELTRLSILLFGAILVLSACSVRTGPEGHAGQPWTTYLLNKERSNVSSEVVNIPSKPYWTFRLWTVSELLRPYDTPRTSFPAVVDGIAYLGTGGEKFYALDLDGKRVLWSFETEGDVDSPPTVDGSYVYFGTSRGVIYALSREDGEERWRFNVDSEIFASPLFLDGIVIVSTTDDELIALDAEEGSRLWRHKRSYARLVKPRLRSAPAGSVGKVFHLFSDGVLISFDAGTGRMLWEKKVVDENFNKLKMARRTPYIVDGDLYLLNSKGFVSRISGENGAVLDEYDNLSARDFLINGRKIFLFGDEEMISLRLDTRETLWKRELPYGSPLSALGSRDYILTITGYFNKPFDLALFGKDRSRIEVIETKGGTMTFETELDARLSPNGVVYGEYVMVLTEEGYLVVFRNS